jgi:hypothetical protein
MKRILFTVVFLLLLGSSALALTVAGVSVEPTVTLNSQTLNLNGTGIRSKFFIKVYVGAFYAERKLGSSAAVLADPGSKLIRMNFVHSRVAKEKIVDAFSEGFANNTQQLTGKAEVKEFLSLFKNDFVEGDIVDLALASDGAVSASHNGRLLGTIRSPLLARGVLGIYFGDEPADKDLKAGMLGRD